jgi:hypothetical protein
MTIFWRAPIDYRVPNCFMRLSMYFDQTAADGDPNGVRGFSTWPSLGSGHTSGIAAAPSFFAEEPVLCSAFIANLLFYQSFDVTDFSIVKNPLAKSIP